MEPGVFYKHRIIILGIYFLKKNKPAARAAGAEPLDVTPPIKNVDQLAKLL